MNLTPRQAQLAALVAQGKKNTEIAAILGISGPTVKFHLERIFKANGYTSRVQLAIAFSKKPRKPRPKRVKQLSSQSLAAEHENHTSMAAAPSPAIEFLLPRGV